MKHGPKSFHSLQLAGPASPAIPQVLLVADQQLTEGPAAVGVALKYKYINKYSLWNHHKTCSARLFRDIFSYIYKLCNIYGLQYLLQGGYWAGNSSLFKNTPHTD